jgi:DNA polymerase
MDLLLDIETYCDLDLPTVGVTKYTQHPSFKILSLAFKAFDPVTMENAPTQLWTFQNPVELNLCNYDYIWALNATFDFLGVTAPSTVNTSQIIIPGTINRWKDIQVVLSKFSLPQNLEGAAQVLNTPIKKNPAGNLYIKRCCKKNSIQPTQEDYNNLFEYNKTDIDASFEVLKACPSMKVSNDEWELWRETFRMNQRGLPIQYEAVESIKVRCDEYKEVICDMLPDLTGGLITKPTQTKRIKDYLISRGVKVKDITADTLEKLIDDDDYKQFLPTDCRTLIEARQAAGASSVAKFDKLLDMRVGNKVHDFLRYGATNTQRWAGAGYQIHSLPKATVADPEELLQRFLNFEEIENPIHAARALCRSVIQAPTGQMLYQADYSSIEYLLLIWITDMYEMLQRFEDDKSAYIDMAAFLYNKKYEEIDKHAIDNLEYFMGKQVILGCGYQMGPPKFKETCARFGVNISQDLAVKAVKGYRQKYAPIAKLWDNVFRACIASCLNPGHEFNVNKCTFISLKDKQGTSWLIITLPSGTKLFYHSPEVTEGKYGHELKHMGLHNYKWTHRFLSPGRITENIIQKLARDLMGYSILTVSRSKDFIPLMTVHDELVSISSEDFPKERLERYIKLVEEKPKWAETIPLKAGGYYGRRYKKD